MLSTRNKARFMSVITILAMLSSFANVSPAVAQEPTPPAAASLVLPGLTQGTGTHFALPDSPYLPVTLDSSAAVTLTLSSVPEVVDLTIGDNAAVGSAQFTLSGFAANTLYYHYEDEGLNPTTFTTDATGSITFTQDLTVPHHVWFRDHPSTYYLYDDATGGNCTAFGTWSSATKTCTMTQDVYQSIWFQANGITLDGDGFNSLYSDNYYAVYSYGYGDVTIKNLNISGSSYGIQVGYGNNITVTNNTVSGGYRGIYTYGSNNLSVTNNTITNTSDYGIYNDSNYYYGGGSANIAQNTISGSVSYGILISIYNNSGAVSVTDNTISGSGYTGIYLQNYYGSSAASVTNNTISGPFSNGIYYYGYGSSGNTIFDQNTISGSSYGIQAYYPSHWTVTKNTISNSVYYGLYLYDYNNGATSIYNNNFINNSNQIYNSSGSASFNKPAPVGGNFFSNFNTPGQGCNDANSDNFCDTAYVFSGGQDNLPWTVQSLWLQVPFANADAYSVAEDQSLVVPAPGVLGNDSDLQNDPLTPSLASGPANGTLSFNTDGSFTYTPNADFNGSDSFTYSVSDGTYSSVAKVKLTVNSVNDAPIVDLNGTDGSGIDFATSFLAGDPPVLIGDLDLTLTDPDSGVTGTAVSGSGMIYVLDYSGRIIAIDPTTGTQTTVISSMSPSYGFFGIAIDSATQELFVTNTYSFVTKVDIATGVASTVATDYHLNSAWGIDLDADGNIYVATYYYGVVRIDRASGAVTQLTPGNYQCYYGLAVEEDGTILVTDPCYSRIVKVDPITGAQTTLANNIYSAYDIAINPTGDLFVVELGQSGKITQVDPTSGATTQVSAGSSLVTGCSYGIEADGAGNLITVDYCSGRVVETAIDTGAQASLATLPQYGPFGVAVDAGGGLQKIKWGTLQITNLLDGANELLAADTTGTNISATYVPATGKLSLMGDDTVENYQMVLRTVTYNNAAANPSGSNRIIDVVIFDGTDSNSPVAQSTITLTPPDSVAPTASPTQLPAANGTGWNNTDVTVDWNWTDNAGGSGIDNANCTTSTVSSGEGNITLNEMCKDLAGNTGAASYAVKVDKSKPTISAAATTSPNGAGWYNGNVTVHFTCADAGSGIPLGTCPADQTLSAEGAAVSSTAQTVTDAAGNTSDASNVVIVQIDKTKPTVSLVGGPANSGSYYFGSVPAAPTCSASDALSGLDGSCAVSGYSALVGSQTVTATANDNAGNQNSASSAYTVLAWTTNGFFQPVDMGGVWNTVKNGSTVPLKFEVFAGSTELTSASIVNQPLTATQTLCTGGTTDDIELLASGTTSLRYDATAGQFIYNWQTPKKAGYCYVVTVKLADGTSISANFKLK